MIGLSRIRWRMATTPPGQCSGVVVTFREQGRVMDGETWDGRQLTAARALAGLTVRDLANLAHTTKRIIGGLQTRGEIHVAEAIKHGPTSVASFGSGSWLPYATPALRCSPKDAVTAQGCAGSAASRSSGIRP